MYFATGPILTALIYDFHAGYKNSKKPGGKFWVDQNLVKCGKIVWINVFGFFIFCLIYLLVQNLAFITMWFCALAGINVGVITVIWAISPLFLAVSDYFLFGQ